MIVLRLSRTGKTRQPNFRLILQEKTSSPKRDFIEVLGAYSPASKDKTFTCNDERVKYWISQGARPSDSVAVMLKKKGYTGMEKFIAPRDKKLKKKGAEEKAA